MPLLSAIGNIPPELHWHILDFLVGDTKTLWACSLTCKLWTDQAQRNLYKVVTLSGNNLDAFCAAMKLHAQLADHIQELTLVRFGRIPDRLPPSLYPTRIRLLRLVEMPAWEPWLLSLLSMNNQTIQQLSLRGCDVRHSAEFLALFAALPHLKDVDIAHTRVFNRAPVLAPGTAAVQNVWSLSLVGVEHQPMLPNAVLSIVLSCPEAYTNLAILRIRIEYGHVPLFDNFLKGVGPNLLELDLGLGYVTIRQSESSSSTFRCAGRLTVVLGGNLPLSLEHCPRLVLLTLKVKILARYSQIFHAFPCWVSSLLATAGGEKLKRIKLVLSAFEAAEKGWGAIDMRPVGRVLEEARFKSMTRVIVQISRNVKAELFATFVRVQLAGLDARGILHVKHR